MARFGSAELALVGACAVWPPSPADVRHAAAAGVDWDHLVRVALRHDLPVLVAEGLRRADLPVPGRLVRAAHRTGRTALAQAREALRLQDLLATAGINALFLKGSALAQLVYGTIGTRAAADIDMAVAPEHVGAAWRVMRDAGYVAEVPRRLPAGGRLGVFLWAAKDSYNRHAGHGLVVELHWRLSDDLRDGRLPAPGTWQWVEIAPGRAIATLGDEDLFVYLCTHGAAHAWARLKWLADVAALMSRSGDGGARFWRAAQAAGADRAAASAFLLAHQLLRTPLPPGFAEPNSRRLRTLNALALRAITAGGAARGLASTRYHGWAELAAKLLVAPGMRNRLAVVRRILVSAEDVGELALPVALSFLYPVVRAPRWISKRVRRARALSVSRSRSGSS